MAKQVSLKQQLIQQLANQTVQQLNQSQNQQQIQQLQAEYDAWNNQQQIQALQSEYDAWLKAQQPQPVQEVQQPQVQKTAQPTQQIPSIAQPKKQTVPVSMEDYQRQQQEENMLASSKNKNERSVVYPLAGNYLAIKTQKDLGQPEDKGTVGESVNQLDLSKYDLPQTERDEAAIKQFQDLEKVKAWTDPNYKMTKDEEAEAKRIAREGIQRLEKNENIDGAPVYIGRKRSEMTPQEQAEYDLYKDLELKTSNVGSYALGAFKEAYDTLRPMIEGMAASQGAKNAYLLEQQARMTGNDYQEEADQWRGVGAREKEALKEFDENSAPVLQNAKTQNPIAYGAGVFTTKGAKYAATNPMFDAIGAAAGGGELAAFLANQAGQNLQDLAIDTFPEYLRLKEQGYSDDQIREAIKWNILGNGAGNLAFGTIPMIPGAAKSVYDKLGYNSAIKAATIPGIGDEVAQAAAEQTAQSLKDLDALSKSLPVIEDADTVANNQLKSLMDTFNSRFKDESAMKDIFTPEDMDASQNRQLSELMKNNFRENSLDNSPVNEYVEGVKSPTANNGGVDYGNNAANNVTDTGIQPGIRTGANGNESTRIQGSGGMDEATGQIGRTDNGISEQSSVNTVPPELRQKMDSAKIRNVGLVNNTDAARFSSALDEARKLENNAHGVFVSPKSPEEVQEILNNGGKSFLSDDGTAGLIVTKDGDIEGVFYNKGLAKKLGLPEGGSFTDLMLTAIANGGKKLDCYGQDLAAMYARMGFEPVVGTKYIPGKEWSAEMDAWKSAEAAKNGVKPNDINTDVYAFKLRDGWTVDDVMEAMQTGSLKEYANSLDLSLDAINKNVPGDVFNLPEDDIYDSMLKYRDSLIKEQPKQGAFFDGDNSKVMAEDIGLNPKTSEPFEIEEIPETSAPMRAGGSSDVVSGEVKERGLSRHINGEETPMKMEGISDEVAADFKDDPDLYVRLKNADTKAKAERIYNTSDNPETEFRALLEKKDPAALPLGHQIAKDYSSAGNHEAAAQIYRDMGKALTESGQFSQAAVINMVKNDPLTALQYAMREIDQINKDGLKKYGKKWKNFSLLDDEIKMFDNIKPGDADAIKAAYEKIGVRLGQEYPSTMMDKIVEFRRAAMLFNPRTVSRNTLANPPTMAMRWVSDRVEAVGQNIAHIINPDIQVTQSLYGAGKTGRKLATDVYNSPKLKAMVDTAASKADIPELKNSVMRNRQVFKGGFLSDFVNKHTNNGITRLNEAMGYKGTKSMVQTWINSAYKGLEVTDNPFVRENFIQRLGSYIEAQKIKNLDDIPDEAVLMAWEEAMKATYKDNSQLVKAIRKFKGGIEDVGDSAIPGLGKVVSQSSIPFIQAPGNIGQRMIDYSPVGFAKGMAKIIKGAKANDVKAVQKGIEEISKGLTGTGLVYLGMKLAQSGILTGTYSENAKEKAFQKQQGFREFALHVGDQYHTIGWAQPFAQSLMAGVLIQNAIDNSDQMDSDILKHFGYEGTLPGKAIGVTKEATGSAVNSWFNETPLKNLAELMGGSGYGQTDIAGNIWENGVEDFAGALVPAALSATAKVTDTTQRQTYDPSDPFGTFINAQKAKIPKLSKELPAKYDTWGRPVKYGETKGQAAVSKFLYPGDFAVDKQDKIDNEISRLFNEAKDSDGNLIQDNGVFPTVAPYSVGDKKLTAEEVSKYQKDIGERNRTLVENFINSSEYSKISDSDKVDTIKKLYGLSKAVTERDKFGKQLSDSSEYKKLASIYDKKGVSGVLDELSTKRSLSSAGVNDSEGARAILEDKGESGLKTYGKIKDKLDGSTSSEKIEKALNSTSMMKSEKAEYYSYLKPDASPGANPYGYVPGINYDPKEDKSYQKAKSEIPSLKPVDYYKTKDTIDGMDKANGTISQDELVAYMNANNVSEADMMKYWKAYGQDNWKKVPYLQGGTWVLPKK